MNEHLRAQTRKSRQVIETLDCEFARLLSRLQAIVCDLPIEVLYQKQISGETAGEGVLRSAAIIEQVFGGITANLWDDPFEWTLPETLNTRERLLEYLGEVELTRKRAFDRFLNDADLLKEVAVPSGEIRPLFAILLETLVHATFYHGRAANILKLSSEVQSYRVVL